MYYAKAEWSDLEYFLLKWPVLVPSGEERSVIQKELNKYRVTQKNQIPTKLNYCAQFD